MRTLVNRVADGDEQKVREKAKALMMAGVSPRLPAE